MRTAFAPVALMFAASMLAGCAGDEDGADTDAIGPGQVLVRGVVVTAAIVPIPNATVTAEPGGHMATTDAEGDFLLGPLDEGAYALTAEADGYGKQRLAIDVVAGRDDLVNVVLEAMTSDVPYHEVEHFRAFIECTYAQNLGGAVGGDFSCFGVTDLVLGVKVDRDVNHFPMHVNAGGFKGLLLEMVWDEQSTGPSYAVFIRNIVPVGEVGGLNMEHQYFVNSSRNPLRDWVYQGVENPGAYDGDVFHPDPAVAADYEILVGGVTSGEQPVEVAVTLNQYLDLFVTRFYNALGDPSYTLLMPA